MAESGDAFLEQRLALVAEQVRLGHRAYVAFDLDNTMFDTRWRTLQIAQRFDDASGIGRLGTIPIELVGADARETCARVGGCTEDEVEAFHAYWAEEFWNGSSFVHDRGVEPVHTWARRALDAGAHVLFLTGRIEPLRDATARQLAASGFAPGGTIELVLKPQLETNTLAYKASVLLEMAQRCVLGWYVSEGRAEIAHLRKVAPEGPWVLLDCSLEEGGPEVPLGTPVLTRAF